MTKKEWIINEAPKHINATSFRIQGIMIDTENNGEKRMVTCLVWETGYIAIDLLWF